MLKRPFYLICLATALLALYRILRADDGLVRTSAVADGIPIEVFTPSPSQPVRPGPVSDAVVIAHGYAGSKQVMYELARSAASLGTIAVVFDFSGHGANQTALTGSGRADQLDSNLDRVVRYVSAKLDIAESRIALLGHSMGAGVVVRYAMQHPNISAVVSISGNNLDVTPTAPKNLLLIAGGLEFDSIKNAQKLALSNAGGERTEPTDWAAHLARASYVVPGVEHLTVLWSVVTGEVARQWLWQAYADPTVIYRRFVRELEPFVYRAIAATIALNLACFLLFFPLATYAATRFGLSAAPPTRGLAYWRLIAVVGVPAVLTPLILRALYGTPLDPAQLLPIQIVNYLAIHFLLYGMLMAGCLRWLSGRGAFATVRWSWLAAAGATLFFAWLFVTNGLVAHLTWMNFLPAGSRLWLVPVVFLLIAPYFVLNEVVTKAGSLGRGARNELTSKLALIGSLLLAVALTPGLFFLLLVIGMFALFFTAYGAYSLHLHRLTGNPLVAALGYAAMTAALLVAVFPITA